VSQQVYCYYTFHKTSSHHCTILRLRDRSRARSIFPDAVENAEIIRLIVRTIPQIFWIKQCEPPTGRCNLQEIVKEIRASSKAKLLFPFNSEVSLFTQRTFAYLHKLFFVVSSCMVKQKHIRFIPLHPSMRRHLWFRIGVRVQCLTVTTISQAQGEKSVEQEEVEIELARLDPIDSDAASDGASISDGRPESGAHRVWASIRHTVCLPRSTFEDWDATFTFLSGLIRGWRDGSR
jgi:hypothetical protein